MEGKEMKEYQIKYSGGYVGLFYWGRKYMGCVTPTWLKGITRERAEEIARAFGGTVSEREAKAPKAAAKLQGRKSFLFNVL